MDEESKKWKLNMGCHKGTLMSRDSVVGEYDSLADCKKAVAQAEQSWAQGGYFVWYADAYGPNGEEEKLHPGTPCS